MITMDKIAIYEKYNGNYDMFSRCALRKEKDAIDNSDFLQLMI